MRIFKYIGDYIIAFCLVLSSNTVYQTELGVNANVFRLGLTLLVVFTCLLTLLLMVASGHQTGVPTTSEVTTMCILYVPILAILFGHLTYFVNTPSRLLQFLLLFFLFVPVIWVYMVNLGYQRLISAYINIVVVISAISLFFWFFASLLKLVYPTGSVVSTWGAVPNILPKYYNLYFETQNTRLMGESFIRNSGIFTEAPAYAFTLSLAFLSELLLKQTKSYFKILILAITLFSTLTSTGFLILFLTMMAIGIAYLTSNQSLVSIMSILVIFIVGLIITLPNIWNLISDKSGTLSTAIRADDYIAGIKSWLTAPLLGHGFLNMAALSPFMNTAIRVEYSLHGSVVNTGIANGWTSILSDGGLTLVLYYSFLLLFPIINGKQKKVKIFFFCLLFMTFIVVLEYLYVFLFFLMMGLVMCYQESNIPDD